MKKIFIVEDELDFAENIEAILRNSGHDIVGIEKDGQQAYIKILESKPDLILMDVMLNGAMDGIELTKKIQESQKTPIIFMSAFSDKENLERISRLTYDSFLLKPFTKDVLIATINLTIFKTNKNSQNRILQIRNKGLIIQIFEENIVMLKADRLYTKIYTIDKQYVIRDILKDVILKLSDKQFTRIHKSYYVNLNYVTAFNAKEVYLGDHIVPIRRGYFKQLGELLHKNQEN